MSKQVDKYSFQDNAIKNIIADFEDKPSSNLLLVIPTGGGKTLTAIRTINELIKNGSIDSKNKCLWITHRRTLKEQTIGVRDSVNWKNKFNFDNQIKDLLQVEMVSKGIELIENNSDHNFKYLVIDECHHSSAQSYKTFFEDKKLGILGLTATPTRLDKKDLFFDKTSYQITFSKLVKKGVIIKPTFQTKNTNELITTSDTESIKESEKFNTYTRNEFIVKDIIANKEDYSKIIIYVNTVKHAEALYDMFNEFPIINEHYDLVGYFNAGKRGNPLKIDPNEYLDKFKSAKKAIIINTNMISEGFDDPNVNTVALAVPTSSLVKYIQCVGRAIRNPDQSSVSQETFVVEYSDNMPNISYRITSGWLFADISDDLEPKINDVFVRDKNDLIDKLKDIAHEFNIPNLDIKNLKISEDDFDNFNFFIYSAVKSLDKNKWHAISIDEDRKDYFLHLYNNINHGIFNKVSPTSIFDHSLKGLNDPGFDFIKTTPRQKNNLYNAMHLAFKETLVKEEVRRLQYFIFHKMDYPLELEEFLKDCFNKDAILAEFKQRKKEDLRSYILKFPSKIIEENEAYYCTNEQFHFCEEFLLKLEEKINNHKPYEVNSIIESLLNDYNSFDIPIRFIDGLCLINRDKLKYFLKI